MLATIAVAIDLSCVSLGQWYDVRFALALISFSCLVVLLNGDVKSLGLCLRPVQGWKPWVAWSFRIGLAVAFMIVVYLGVWIYFGNTLPVSVTSPGHVIRRTINACLVAPYAVNRMGV